jgi:DNA-binding LacI/PurR family transcriptional regulator
MKKRQKLTIYDLAEEANVSIATVSRALNAETRRKVAAKKLQEIDELIEKYHFAPNLAAKSLVQARTQTLGVILPHHSGILLEDYYSQVLCGISDEILESEYQFKMLMLKTDKKKWDGYDFQFAEGIDGLIVNHWHSFFSSREVFERLGIPCVVINDPELSVRAHFVTGDHFQGGREVAEYLYRQGHRGFAVVTGSPDSEDSRLRLEGFQSFLGEVGLALSSDAIVCGHFQEGEASRAVETLFSRNSRPGITAIFCLNDQMALGAIRKLKELGIACPEEVSVVGYDNLKRGEKSEPPLTSVHVPLYEMGRGAAHQLISFLSGEEKESFFHRQTTHPVSLVVRNSVRRIENPVLEVKE